VHELGRSAARDSTGAELLAAAAAPITEREVLCELEVRPLFVVVVLWDDDATRWVGWLTTFDRRSLCFSSADLENVEFRQWLAELAGWEPCHADS
jgi:hypothetical protein